MATAEATPVAISTAPPRGSLWQRIQPKLLPAFTVLAIIYLMIPIAVMIIFSFNEPIGKFNYQWNQFSLQGWLHPFDWPGLGDAVRTSLVVALISTIFATILGTATGVAVALVVAISRSVVRCRGAWRRPPPRSGSRPSG